MIATANVTLPGEGPRPCNGYLARPEAGRGPGVVVMSDMFGLNEPIRAIADDFARIGSPALVPNLFWRSGNPGVISYDDADHPEAWERLKALDLGVTSTDIGGAVAWLRAQACCNGKVIAVGFCGGGRVAYLAASRAGVDGAASLYGVGISQHLDELRNVTCPLQIHYGLRDQHVPRSEIDTVAKAVEAERAARGSRTEVFLYPEAGHSFFNPVRPTYDPAAAKLAAARIAALLASLR